MVVRSGGSASTINFDPILGGHLELDGSQIDFTKTVLIGFASPVNDTIDLSDIAFNANTKATFAPSNTSGTLTVTNGSQTANLTLLGQYSADNFSLSSDGHGGTIIVDPLVGSAGHPVLAPPA